MNLVPVAYKSIRLTIVIFSSNNCQTKVQQLSHESSTTVRRLNLSIMNTKSVCIKN